MLYQIVFLRYPTVSTPEKSYIVNHIDGLMQKKRDSSALAMELRLFYIKPSICALCWVV